jgi:transposase
MSCGRSWSLWFQRGSGRENNPTGASREAGASPCRRGGSSPPSCTFCAPDANGKRCPGSSAVPARCTSIFRTGTRRVFSSSCGRRDWPNTTACRASPGSGKASTGPWEKRRWPPSARGGNPTDRGKKGRKRSLLTDGRGVPLSLVAGGANVHDMKLLESTLDGLVCQRPKPTKRRPQHLCADAGYKGDPALQAAPARNYRPHIKQRKEEADAKRRKPGWKARRWVVERTHSWFNRYRKLLVSFEKPRPATSPCSP